jgi:hypothetical protein
LALKDAPLGTKSSRSLPVRDLFRRRFFVGRESLTDWARDDGVFLRARWTPNEAVRESASSPESDMTSCLIGGVEGRSECGCWSLNYMAGKFYGRQELPKAQDGGFVFLANEH